MAGSWLEPSPEVFCALGPVSAVLGVTGLLLGRVLKRWRRAISIAALVLFLTATGAAMSSGQPPEAWLAPLAVAAVSGLSQAARLPSVGRVLATTFARFRDARLEFITLIVAGPALTLWWTWRIEEALAPPATLFDLEVETTSPQLTVATSAMTDRGRPVSLFRYEGEPFSARALAVGEERAIRGHTLIPQLIRLAPPDPKSDCHGWVFTGGLYLVRGVEVEYILQDNGYHPVAMPESGDLAVYRNVQGAIIHTGLVRLGTNDGLVLIESKWGSLGRYLHRPEAQPYSGVCAYYRSSRSGHLLLGLGGESPSNLSFWSQLLAVCLAPPTPAAAPAAAE